MNHSKKIFKTTFLIQTRNLERKNDMFTNIVEANNLQSTFTIRFGQGENPSKTCQKNFQRLSWSSLIIWICKNFCVRRKLMLESCFEPFEFSVGFFWVICEFLSLITESSLKSINELEFKGFFKIFLGNFANKTKERIFRNWGNSKILSD